MSFQDLTDAGKLEKDGELWDTWLDQYTGRLRQEEEGVEDLTRLGDERVTTMNSNNPRFVVQYQTLSIQVDYEGHFLC